MAYYFSEPSHTFQRISAGTRVFLCGVHSGECKPAARQSLSTKRARNAALYANIPLVSAIMQAVSDDQYGDRTGARRAVSPLSSVRSPSQSEAAMVARVKNYKAGFVVVRFQRKAGRPPLRRFSS